MRKTTKLFIIVNLALMMILVMPLLAFADTDIKIQINDPDQPAPDVISQEANIVYTALSSPQVSRGDNRELGTLRVTGKSGVTVPIAQGKKIQITLPVGISYMQVPNQKNYRNYVEWPSLVDGQANQIADQNGKPGLAFVAGSPRSLTLQVENLNTSAPIMLLDFVFNKPDYSMVRISSLLDKADEYEADANGNITRLEFLKLLREVSVTSFAVVSTVSKPDWEANLVDLNDLSAADLDEISPLMAAGLVCGYPDGKLHANQYITRAEAAYLAGRLFNFSGKNSAFKDAIPAWAAAGIDSAVSGGIVQGYSDGTFRADALLTKSEALSILQNCLESNLVQS